MQHNRQLRSAAGQIPDKQAIKANVKEVAQNAAKEIIYGIEEAIRDGGDPDKVVDFVLGEFRDRLDAEFYKWQTKHSDILEYTWEF